MSMSTPGRGEKKRSDDAMHVFFSCLTCPVFFKITRPNHNFEFSKLPVTNPEHDFLHRNFLFVRLQIKLSSKNILVIFLAPIVIHI